MHGFLSRAAIDGDGLYLVWRGEAQGILLGGDGAVNHVDQYGVNVKSPLGKFQV